MQNKSKYVKFYNFWLFFTLWGIQKPFFENINTVFVPVSLQGFLNYLPYFICFCCFIYYFFVLKGTISYKVLIFTCLFFLFLIGMKWRGMNNQIDDRMLLIYIFFQLIIFLSFSCIRFYDSFFEMGKFFFIVCLLFVPVLLYIYFLQFKYNLLFDYMLLGQGLTPICLFFLLLWYQKSNYLYLISSLSLFVIILMFTNRGSFLWTFLAYCFVFMKLPKKRKIQILIVLLFCVCIFSVFFYDKIDLSASRTLTKLLDHSATTSSGRDKYYNFTLEQIDLHPFFGQGIYKSRKTIANALNIQIINAAYPHNFFLELFLQFGIILPVFAVFLYICSAYVQQKNIKKQQKEFFLFICFSFFLRLMLSGTYLIDFSIPLLLGFVCNNTIKKV